MAQIWAPRHLDKQPEDLEDKLMEGTHAFEEAREVADNLEPPSPCCCLLYSLKTIAHCLAPAGPSTTEPDIEDTCGRIWLRQSGRAIQCGRCISVGSHVKAEDFIHDAQRVAWSRSPSRT